MASPPCFSSSSFARLKGREPKKPLCADSGLGCADSMQGTGDSNGLRLRALRPQRMATSGPPRAASARIACSVTSSHPLPWWEFGRPGWTVSALFSSRTPRSVHGPRSPLDGAGWPRSSLYSWKMFTRLFGSGRTSGATEKHRPIGWPGVGYGSWPTISTRTSANGCLNARSTFSPDGRYCRPAAISARRNSPIAAMRSSAGASASAQPASTISCSGRAFTRATLAPGLGQFAEPRLVNRDSLYVVLYDRDHHVRRHFVSLANTRRHAERHAGRRQVAVERHHRAGTENRAVLDHGSVEQHGS